MKLRIKPDPKIKNFLWPKYKTGGAAAFDLYLQEDISLRPGEPAEISLGFSTDMDPGWAVEILPRSCRDPAPACGAACTFGTRSALSTLTITAYGARRLTAACPAASAGETACCRQLSGRLNAPRM